MTEQSLNITPEDEISIRDIINFLVDSWKLIILTGFLGLIASIAYLALTPNQYLAAAQIKIPQLIDKNLNFSLSNYNDDSSVMIARLKFPSSYEAEDVKACGFDSSNTSFDAIQKNIKVSLMKDARSIIELNVKHDSKEIAAACVQSLFENIKLYQNKLIEPLIKKANHYLVKNQNRLNTLQSYISQTDKSGGALSNIYLAYRDEVNFLKEEIYRLNIFIESADLSQVSLISPIYASDIPVSPQRTKSLILGFMVGLLIGLIFAIGKRIL